MKPDDDALLPVHDAFRFGEHGFIFEKIPQNDFFAVQARSSSFSTRMRFGSPVGDGVGTGRRDKVPALREKRFYHFRGGVVRVGDQQRRSVNAEREG